MPRLKSRRLVFLQCQRCGWYYIVEWWRAGKSKFCGWSCKQSANTVRNNFAKRGTGVGYVKINGRHQHRVVMEAILGRKLLSREIVHHRDGNKKNNSPENLELMTQSRHIKLHLDYMRARRREVDAANAA